MKNFLILVLFLCFNKIAFGQPLEKVVDSLLYELEREKEDTQKVNILNTISKDYWLAGQYDKALKNANQAMVLAKKINFKKGLANAYRNIGGINIQQANYDEALRNYLISLNIRLEIDDKEALSYTYISIGNIYIQQGNYLETLKNYFAALKIGEEMQNAGIIANAYCSIANVYTLQGNYEEALKKYFASLKLWDKIDDHGVSMAHINIGNIYAKQGNYVEALKNFFAVLELEENLDMITLFDCYSSIGNVYIQQGKNEEALKNYLKALEYQIKMNYKDGIADSYINLGKIYFNLNKVTVAKDYVDKGLHLAKESKNRDIIKNAYSVLSDIDSAMGNMSEAYHYYRLYTKMKDSITNAESTTQISQLKIQYESDKKDEQIKTQELQNRVLQTRIYYGLAIIVIFLIFFYLRNKRKSKEYENRVVGLELKALKSQLNPHFIFNALTSIKLYIDSNPQTGAEYLTRFSLFVRGVLESSEEKEISLGEEMELMEHYLELEKMCLSNNLDYSITYGNLLDKAEIMVPPLITQPIIENAIWHGIITGDNVRSLNIHNSVMNNTLIITISNNAISKVTDNLAAPQKRKSFGMKITRERLGLLKQIIGKEGTINLEMLPMGTRAIITIPLKETIV